MIHNIKAIEFIDEPMQSIKAKETVDIFKPIARRLRKITQFTVNVG